MEEYKYGTSEYISLHTKLRRTRGSASQHDCVDCGGTAQEWSLPHNANQLDLDVYLPRCKKCHRKYDCNTESAKASYSKNTQKLWDTGVLTKEAVSERSRGNKFAQKYVVPEETKQQIAELYLTGNYTVRALCEKFGLTKSVVWGITKKAKDGV